MKELTLEMRARFWAKVEKRDDGCWNWTACTHKGYGRFLVWRSNQRAHRIAYQLLVGPIPVGTELDHLPARSRLYRGEYLRVQERESLLQGVRSPAHEREARRAETAGDSLRERTSV